jgi:uncharacterized protein (DUF1800 family)
MVVIQATAEAAVAHVLRRLTFGPHPGQVAELVGDGPQALIQQLLNNATNDTAVTDPGDSLAESGDDYDSLVNWWLRRLARPDTGLHERLVWFWHNHFVTSIEEVENTMMRGQHELIRKHAAGNFKELFTAIMHDPAMLVYLDGDTSTGDAPNENLAREAMELFGLGNGNYTEADVKAGAKALAGWRVDWETGESWLSEEDRYQRPVELLGVRKRMGVEEFVDTVCAQEACGRHIAGKLHEYFVGFAPDEARRRELAAILVDSNFEILPLVAAIVEHHTFLENRNNIARSPVEWYLAVRAGAGLRLDVWTLWNLGQMPLHPRNVGGWPHHLEWLDRTQLFLRAQQIVQLALPAEAIVGRDDLVTAALEHCGLYDVSTTTQDQLRSVMSEVDAERLSRFDAAHLLLELSLNSPEFALT